MYMRIYTLVSLWVLTSAAAVTAQTIDMTIPAKQILAPNCGTAFNGYGLEGPGDSAQTIVVNVPGVPFTEAVRVTNSKARPYTYNAAHKCSNVAPVNKGDLLVATFWVRNANANPARNVLRIEPDFQNDTIYTQYLITNAPVDKASWTKYVIPFRMREAEPIGGASFQLRFGAAAQTFEFGGISLANYGPLALPLPPQLTETFAFYYPGRGDPNAAWRGVARAGIDADRKAPVSIQITDARGSAVKGAIVSLRQTSSPFNWATSVQPSDIVGGPRQPPSLTAQQRQRYRKAIKENFNSASMQNELKWPDWEGDKVTPIRALEWFAANGLRTRGHNLIWPNDTPDNLLPDDVRNPATPAAMVSKRALDHIDELAGGLKGQMPEWDVVNEPYSNPYLTALIALPPNIAQSNGKIGNSTIPDWFKRARAADPGAKLFLNEFAIFERAEPVKRDYTKALVKYIQTRGAPIDGIGFQAHYATSGPVFCDMAETIEAFDPLVKYFSATEFDSITLDEKMQADVLEDVATFVFGSPKFTTFQIWGFWDGNQDDGNGPLYTRNFKLKPAGAAWQRLTQQTWRTNARGITNANGKLTIRAFLGQYKVTVFACGKYTTFDRGLSAPASFTLPVAC
jgi:endo-1,4-beta-xylanase